MSPSKPSSPSDAEVFAARSLAQTYDLGRQIAQRLGPGDLVALVGKLGAGKTALVRGLALGLGLDDERMVSSPTFVLAQEYPARVPVHHIDVYRMVAPAAELADLGVDEMLETGVVLIEWADRVEDSLPRPYWRIEITATGLHTRRIELRRVE
jgi:tRNA threonylcarbamoyladenosine biosynthesis protein TsaE